MGCPFACKKLKEFAGKAGEGIHKVRLNDAAMVDYIGTLILAIIISRIAKTPLVLTTIILFVLGELLHMICGVKTSTIKYIT